LRPRLRGSRVRRADPPADGGADRPARPAGRGARLTMRISVLGAGPAGLYFAALAKKANPSHRITVFERNPPDATYGWGVVFSEETLGALRDADRPTYDRITESFATWSAIDVKYRGETVRSRGHAFSGLARKQLLAILQDRCRALGVELRFFQE